MEHEEVTAVSDALRGATRFGIDSAPLIYLVERHPVHGPVVREIVARAVAGELELVTSTLTLTEVLTHPIRIGAHEIATAYRDVLLRSPHLAVIPVDVRVAEDAARLRAIHRIRTPDAIQLAAARVAGCNAFLTNDSALSRAAAEIAVVQLADLTIG
jgi:predicted nucleic acid-binding protein